MASILLAGLPEALAGFLEERLEACTLATCQTGGRALELLRDQSFDVLVADAETGDLDVGDLLAQVKALGAVPRHVFCYVTAAHLAGHGQRLSSGHGALLLLRPLDRQELLRRIAQALAIEPKLISGEGRDGLLAKLWQKFRPGAFERLALVDAAAAGLLRGDLALADRREAERAAHKLAGSVGTYGLLEGSQIARRIERLLEGEAPVAQTDILLLCDLVEALRFELEQTPAAPAEDPGGPTTGSLPVILALEGEVEADALWQAELSSAGFAVRMVRDLSLARQAVDSNPIDAVLLELRPTEGASEALGFLAEMRSRVPPVPIVVLSDSADLADRVEVSRLGGGVFLPKPASTARIVAALNRAIGERLHPSARVLSVDDDPSILEAIVHGLAPMGLSVRTLDDPLRFWQTLQEFQPDLILLDIDMPAVSGIDLCRVLRADPDWIQVPVVFLSARRDAETISTLFKVGGDDYLSKPIVALELGNRVRSRLERYRLLRSAAETDALTGLMNRRKVEQTVAHYLTLASRTQQFIGFVLIDIDHFKAINDRHGHGTGDQVLRRLGQAMLQEFRGEDIVARWGGEEFFLAMYGAPKEQTVRRLERFLADFNQVVFQGSDNETFHVSFSAGVVEFPGDGKELGTLVEKADQALYAAKAAGRSQVRSALGKPADPAASGPHDAEVDIVVVDDDESLSTLLLHALQTQGHRVRWFADGESAAQWLLGRPLSGLPRVVVLDVGLPGLDGLSLLQRLGSQGALKVTQVVMLTARTNEREVIRALDLGAVDHVAKPFSLPVLLHKLRALLATPAPV